MTRLINALSGGDEEIIKMMEIDGLIINDHLKNLEKIRLNCFPLHSIYENLFQYCHHLRCLIIDNAYTYDLWDIAWTNQKYSKLETLHLYVDDGVGDLTNFFKLNTHIRTVCFLGTAPISSLYVPSEIAIETNHYYI